MLKALVLVSALIASTQAILPVPYPFGIVEGIIDCGSTGRLGTVELTGCTRVPCELVPHTIYDVALRFTASLTSSNLALHAYRTSDAQLLFDVLINGEIQAGIEYELTFQLPITAEFAGTAFDIRFYILDLQSRLNEVCAQAALVIAPL